jgi:dGTPase
LSIEILQGQQHRIAKRALPGQSPLLEVQCVDAADSIAYNTHDADDAMELGLLKLDDLLETSLWAEAHRRVSRRWTNLGENDLRRALLHELIDWQVSTLIADTRQRLDEQHIESVADVRAAGILVTPTSELSAQQAQLAKLLFSRVYRHPQVLAHRQPAQASLHEMFTALVADPGKLPATFQQRIAAAGLHRTVADYLAGMTDRFARREYERICGKIVVGMVPMP